MEEHELALHEFVKLSALIASERDLNSLSERILSSAQRISGARGGALSLLDQSMRFLVSEVYCVGDRYVRQMDRPPIPLYNGGERNIQNVAIFSLFSGRPVFVDDIYKYSAFDMSGFQRVDAQVGEKSGSLLSVPLVDHKGVSVGVLQLIGPKLVGSDVDEMIQSPQGRVIEAFACQAAVAIENIKLVRENAHLIEVLNGVAKRLENENQALKSRLSREEGQKQTFVIGDSKAIKKVTALVNKVCNSDATVLVTGETGTGKELVAVRLHQNSQRRQRPFVVQNCAALPENLLESELFGYRKGAFSGAVAEKKGLIEMASGGTLFLDEIGDMPLGLQAKILRVLQEKEVRSLGDTVSRKVDVRVIAATHRDLKRMVETGDFREDLYYRLSVFPIELPPLRRRQSDIPALVSGFLTEFSDKYGKKIKGISPDGLDLLMMYEYPGNIRELRNIIERAVLLADEGQSVTLEYLPIELHDRRREQYRTRDALTREGGVESGRGLKQIIEDYEARVIREKLVEQNWNQTRTAETLQVARRTLIEKINRYSIARPDVSRTVQ